MGLCPRWQQAAVLLVALMVLPLSLPARGDNAAKSAESAEATSGTLDKKTLDNPPGKDRPSAITGRQTPRRTSGKDLKEQTNRIARKHIVIVGSSTVYPYSQRVARAFVAATGQPAPKISASGSGMGIADFCRGIGLQYPDIVNASRAMKKTEWLNCKKNGVDDITEIHFGNDGLTLIKSRFGEQINLTLLQLFKAVARKVPVDGRLIDNPYRSWSDIDENLPEVPIQIFGPTISHGSYGYFVKAVLSETCRNNLSFFRSKRAILNDKGKFEEYLKANCSQLRFDGIYIGTDQSIGQMVKLLMLNPTALAIVGYSDLFNRRSSLQAVRIDGVEPRIYTISDRSYRLSRPLYFYIKNAHRSLVPGISQYVKEFMSEQAMGSFGYLVRMGLGVLSVDDLNDAQYAAIIGTRMRRYMD